MSCFTAVGGKVPRRSRAVPVSAPATRGAYCDHRRGDLHAARSPEPGNLGKGTGNDGPAVLRGPGPDAGTAAMPGGPIDLDRAERAVAGLPDALGPDRGADGLAATSARVRRAYAELLTPAPFEVATFPDDEGYDELVVATGVPFCSLCAHHLLPFSGVAHAGYIPGAPLAGLIRDDHRTRAEFLAFTRTSR